MNNEHDTSQDIHLMPPPLKTCFHCSILTKDLGIRVSFPDEIWVCSPCLSKLVQFVSHQAKKEGF
jgi:hypothetical protein